MEAYNTTKYPVFEADQVLSQKDLNMLVSHLEEQDRISRKNLSGIGIVCGLDLTFPTLNSIKISCGTGITSLGFQINWKEAILTHYQEYELSEQFLHPDYTREPYLDAIFKYVTPYQTIKNGFELLPSTSTIEGKLPIPANFFDDKLILLLLETSLIDQKNCVTTNCDDKGKRIEFNLRPMAISLSKLTASFFREFPLPQIYNTIAFPRYNVPFKNLVTSAQVLDAFNKVLDPTFIKTLTDAIVVLYNNHKNSLPANLVILNQSKTNIDKTITNYKNSVNVQYLWDWIEDLVNTYNEIINFKKIHPALCCVDESVFPFHVVLGGNAPEDLKYRTPFYATLNESSKENEKLKQLVLLFEKLALLISSFAIDKSATIKITPSVYGKANLSSKAIPYYYANVLDINKKWNPELTNAGKNDTIFSYYSQIPNYTTKIEVQKPLLYDIEPYNFFRVEGHIGQNYKKALQELNLIRDSYNLPFKITALNAVDFVNKNIDIMKFDGRWDDLETDYDLARKRVYNITEFVINWMDQRKNVLEQKNLMTKQNIANFKNILTQLKNLLTNDLKEFLPNYKAFYDIFKQLNLVFLFHRWCIQLFNPDLTSIAEDLIDRMDDINELFLDDPFTVLYEEANLRWQKLYKEMFFGTFQKKHPGIEHKAGVTKGGTFVVVYVDSTIFKASAPPPKYLDLLNAVTAYKDNINIDDKTKDEIIKSSNLSDYKSQLPTKPSSSSINKCQEETNNIKNDLIELAQYNMQGHYTAEMSGFLLENIKGILGYDLGSLADKTPYQQMVIADFFLPYTCCGEGNTIEIKIETPVPLSITLNPLKFCSDDKKQYEVKIVGKSTGTFSGTGKDALVQSGDKYYLNPNHVSLKQPKTYNLQYEVDGEISNTIDFEIKSPSTLQWTVIRDTTDVNKFIFTNPLLGDTHDYEINFGDGTTTLMTKTSPIAHVFPFSLNNKSFKVSIKQLGEVCVNAQEIVVNIVGDFRSGDFNSNDFFTE